jgi:tartrate-resistant acid phosphatase type 5
MIPHRLALGLLALVLPAGCGQAAERSRPQAVPPASASPTLSPEPRFVFAAKGDWAAGTREQAAVTAQMCEVRKVTPFEVVVTTGDNFYRPDGRATETNFFGPEACLTAYPGHRWRATWGNHDLAGDSTGTVLGAERTYTWTEGPAQFFMLDSNRIDAAQTAWLAAELAASKAQVKVAVYHHPGLTVGLHENNLQVQQHWMPLFEQFGVDLVLNGHNHGYEHSMQNGVHYVVTGGGGAQLYPCVDDQPWLITCLSVNHFLIVDIQGQRISVQAIGIDGRPVDAFER